MATIKNSYRASASLTITLEDLPTSATWVTGRESTAYDNTSNLDVDARLSGIIKLHESTNVTTNTQIIIWVVPEVSDGAWPANVTGSNAALTWTNVEMRDASSRIAAVINIVAVTPNIVYPFDCGSIAALFGGFLPRKFVVFVAQNTGQELCNAAAGTITVTGLQKTVA